MKVHKVWFFFCLFFSEPLPGPALFLFLRWDNMEIRNEPGQFLERPLCCAVLSQSENVRIKSTGNE